MAGIGLGLLAKLKGKRGEQQAEYEWGSATALQSANLDTLSSGVALSSSPLLDDCRRDVRKNTESPGDVESVSARERTRSACVRARV